jgi:hypothetical protein
MPARAMWKAELGIDGLRIPVKLFAAVPDTKIHFRPPKVIVEAGRVVFLDHELQPFAGGAAPALGLRGTLEVALASIGLKVARHGPSARIPP